MDANIFLFFHLPQNSILVVEMTKSGDPWNIRKCSCPVFTMTSDALMRATRLYVVSGPRKTWERLNEWELYVKGATGIYTRWGRQQCRPWPFKKKTKNFIFCGPHWTWNAQRRFRFTAGDLFCLFSFCFANNSDALVRPIPAAVKPIFVRRATLYCSGCFLGYQSIHAMPCRRHFRPFFLPSSCFHIWRHQYIV